MHNYVNIDYLIRNIPIYFSVNYYILRYKNIINTINILFIT